ncbi:MAG: hypothetical protein R3299_06765 [Arenibacter sp.]|nr:hypothetical protein [Arenibacter sp.]
MAVAMVIGLEKVQVVFSWSDFLLGIDEVLSKGGLFSRFWGMEVVVWYWFKKELVMPVQN